MTISEILKQAESGMHKAIENTRRELSGLRSSKASPTLLDTVRVDAYGSQMPLNQVAMVSTPEPRMLVVQPFDKSLAPAIEKAIRDGGLGLNPATQGAIIRVPLPMLSEERRRDLVKLCGRFAEEGRIAIRQARTDANHRLKKLEGISEDETGRAEKDVQKITDDAVSQVDELLKAKEAEVLEV
jgi:ribosome recycling factor